MIVASIGEAIAKAALVGLWWTLLLFVLIALWAVIVETRRWRANKRRAAAARGRTLTLIYSDGRRRRV